MKFKLKGPLEDNINNITRQIGYHSLGKNEARLEYVFVRLINGDRYPRFHLYIKTENGDLIFDLHLDQKAPSYAGTAAHSGEYDTEVVKKEAERIKQILQI
jgi:hypothetical protein